jgi:hypothetical protein
MTRSQLIHLQAELWPNAATTQGWDPRDRAKRLAVISDILGRPILSTTEIETNADFTLVKNRLLTLANSLSQSDPRSTRREKVRRQIKCLALYLDSQPLSQSDPSDQSDQSDSSQHPESSIQNPVSPVTTATLAHARNYVRKIIEHTCARAGFEPDPFRSAPFDSILHALSLPQLDRLVKTLDNRLHNKKTGLRQRAGHTLHQMNLAAGIPCPCRQCHPRPRLTVVLAGADQSDSSDQSDQSDSVPF